MMRLDVPAGTRDAEIAHWRLPRLRRLSKHYQISANFCFSGCKGSNRNFRNNVLALFLNRRAVLLLRGACLLCTRQCRKIPDIFPRVACRVRGLTRGCCCSYSPSSSSTKVLLCFQLHVWREAPANLSFQYPWQLLCCERMVSGL